MLGPNHSHERSAFMRDPYASKATVNPRMPVGELLRGIALVHALHRWGRQAGIHALGSAHYNENCVTNVKFMTYGPCIFQAYVCIARCIHCLRRGRPFQLNHVALRIKQINGRAFALGAITATDLAHPHAVRLQVRQDGGFVVIGHAQA